MATVTMPKFASISAALNACGGDFSGCIYQPIWLAAVHSVTDIVAVALGFAVLNGSSLPFGNCYWVLWYTV